MASPAELKSVFAKRQLKAYERLADAITNFDLVILETLETWEFENKFRAATLALLREFEKNFIYLDDLTKRASDERICQHIKAHFEDCRDSLGCHKLYEELSVALTQCVLPKIHTFLEQKYGHPFSW